MVHIDFWIQNSRLFLKTIISFSRLEGDKGDKAALKKTGTKLFSQCTAKV